MYITASFFCVLGVAFTAKKINSKLEFLSNFHIILKERKMLVKGNFWLNNGAGGKVRGQRNYY